MINQFFPIKHPFTLLSPNPYDKVDVAIKDMLTNRASQRYYDDIFGHTVSFDFSLNVEEALFSIDNDCYYFDNFVVSIITNSSSNKDHIGLNGPDIIAAELYHSDDAEGRHSNNKRLVAYINNQCLEKLSNYAVRDRLMFEKLSKNKDEVPHRYNTVYDEWDFPIFAMQMLQRELAIDPRI